MEDNGQEPKEDNAMSGSTKFWIAAYTAFFGWFAYSVWPFLDDDDMWFAFFLVCLPMACILLYGLVLVIPIINEYLDKHL
jgi:apolipoprotein N-acyltransferase